MIEVKAVQPFKLAAFVFLEVASLAHRRTRIRASVKPRKGDCLLPMRNMEGVYVRNITQRQAAKLVASGQAKPSYSEPGKLVGIRLTVRLRAVDSSPCTITKSDILVNAHQIFEDGKSHTSKMNERKKRTRIGRGFVPEDRVESAVAKITLWPLIGSAKAVRVGFTQKTVADAIVFESTLHFEGAGQVAQC